MATKEFEVIINHEFFEDSWTEGEGSFVNSYTETYDIKSTNWIDAVISAMNQSLIPNFDIKNTIVCDDVMHYRVHVNIDSEYASAEEVVAWIAGEMELFADNISITVNEKIKVEMGDFEPELYKA